jgi:spore germination cell wall hydrolase CwlJ-like protein
MNTNFICRVKIPAFILSVGFVTSLAFSNLVSANVQTEYNYSSDWIYYYEPVNIPRSPQQDLEMLALTLYHEGRSESIDGLYAIANVIENRVVSKHWPDTIVGVVKQKAQFSFWQDVEDLKMREFKSRLTAYRIASKVIKGEGKNVVGNADHYFNPYKVKPKWSDSMVRVKKIDNHVFLKR